MACSCVFGRHQSNMYCRVPQMQTEPHLGHHRLPRLMKLRSDKEVGAVLCPCPMCKGICEQVEPAIFDRAAHSLCFDGWTRVDMIPPQRDTLYHCRVCESIFSEVVWDDKTGSGPYFWVRSRWHMAATSEPGFWSFEGRGLEDDLTPQ